MNAPQQAQNFTAELLILGKTLKRLLLCAVLLGIIAYVLSGVYFIRTGDTGVLKRFGEVIDDGVEPGIHYRLPWPVDSVVRVSTGEILRVEAGFGAHPDRLASFEKRYGPVENYEYSSLIIPYCMSGDRNVIHLNVIVVYQIADPDEFLHSFAKPEGFLVYCAQEAILESCSKMDVDSLLLTGKIALRAELSEGLQKVLKEKDSGIRVVSVEIKRVRPPREVSAAFKDVVDAQGERVTAVHDAEAYRNQVLPEAKAQAARAIAEAESYATRQVAEADGQASSFEMLLTEYRKSPDLLEKRIYVESMAEILSKIEKYIIANTDGRDAVDLGIIGSSGR